MPTDQLTCIMAGCGERFSSHAQEDSITFAFYKTKNMPDDGTAEYCVQLSSLLSEQGSSFFSVQQAQYILFLQKEKNSHYWNNQVTMFSCQNLFAFPALPHGVTKSTHFAIYFSRQHKAHKTRAILSQGNNGFVRVRSSSHLPERRHSLADGTIVKIFL